MRFVVVALLVFGFAGCLSVDTPDGALMCSTVPKRACPEGFYCLASSDRCWRVGHFPDDMAIPMHFNPGGPDRDFSFPVEDDLGTDDAATGGDDLSSTD